MIRTDTYKVEAEREALTHGDAKRQTGRTEAVNETAGAEEKRQNEELQHVSNDTHTHTDGGEQHHQVFSSSFPLPDTFQLHSDRAWNYFSARSTY